MEWGRLGSLTVIIQLKSLLRQTAMRKDGGRGDSPSHCISSNQHKLFRTLESEINAGSLKAPEVKYYVTAAPHWKKKFKMTCGARLTHFFIFSRTVRDKHTLTFISVLFIVFLLNILWLYLKRQHRYDPYRGGRQMWRAGRLNLEVSGALQVFPVSACTKQHHNVYGHFRMCQLPVSRHQCGNAPGK